MLFTSSVLEIFYTLIDLYSLVSKIHPLQKSMQLKAINCYPQNGECYLSFDHAADRAESEVKLHNTHKQQICTTPSTFLFPPSAQ